MGTMIDLRKLLEPIGQEVPAGPDLRLVTGDTTISDIEEARREEDPAVDVSGQGKDADWPTVVRSCETALAGQSKDLQLAAHLTEGLAWTEGFPGVLEGIRLMSGLLDQYWDGVHPGVEDGEIIPPVRAKWISWLGTSRDFLTAFQSIPLTSGPGVPGRSWLDYQNSLRVDEAGLRADQGGFREMIERGMIPGAEWQAAMASTPMERLAEIVENLKAIQSETRALDTICTEKFESPPDLTGLSGCVADCLEYLEDRVQASSPGPSAAAASPQAAPPTEASAGAPAAATDGGGPISSRDEAYRRLREAADYLRRTEPHSPVPYLVERACSWGQMPFQDLLQDVLKDAKARASVLETLGMRDLPSE
jgi:type VI secretion system ImpA family protein